MLLVEADHLKTLAGEEKSTASHSDNIAEAKYLRLGHQVSAGEPVGLLIMQTALTASASAREGPVVLSAFLPWLGWCLSSNSIS